MILRLGSSSPRSDRLWPLVRPLFLLPWVKRTHVVSCKHPELPLVWHSHPFLEPFCCKGLTYCSGLLAAVGKQILLSFPEVSVYFYALYMGMYRGMQFVHSPTLYLFSFFLGSQEDDLHFMNGMEELVVWLGLTNYTEKVWEDPSYRQCRKVIWKQDSCGWHGGNVTC